MTGALNTACTSSQGVAALYECLAAIMIRMTDACLTKGEQQDCPLGVAHCVDVVDGDIVGRQGADWGA